jgi:hypothetical protein
MIAIFYAIDDKYKETEPNADDFTLPFFITQYLSNWGKSSEL